jgi:hypothetical protein
MQMKRYITTRPTIIWRKPGRVPLGWIKKDFEFTLSDSVPGYLAFKVANKIGKTINWWISANAAIPLTYAPPVEPPPLGNNCQRLRFHSQIAEGANYGSFGIVPFSATSRFNKPHSVILDHQVLELYRDLQSQAFYDANIQNYPCDNPEIRNVAGQPVDPVASFQWLFEHGDNKFYGAHYENTYRIPAQGCFGGNQVSVLKTEKGSKQIAGVTATKLPAIDQLYNRPDLVHFCWCVGTDGRTLNPPCKSAFVLVLNPVGMQGVTNSLNQQTEIWIENKWFL